MKKLKLYQAAVLGLLWIIAVATIAPLQTDAAKNVFLVVTVGVYGIGLFAIGKKEGAGRHPPFRGSSLGLKSGG